MSPRRRNPAELDALLDGGASGDPRLDQVLSAARGPARPHELVIPPPAVGVDSPAEPPSRTRRVLTRLGAATLATKVSTAVAGAAVVGAAAVAGATHHLPGQHRPAAPLTAASTSTGEPSTSGARSDTSSSRAPQTPRSSSVSTSAPTSTSTSPSTSPRRSRSGAPDASGAAHVPTLCRVWLALPPGSDAVRQEPRFVVLIHAAGGVDAVTAYCRSLPTLSASGLPTSTGSVRVSPSPSLGKTRSGVRRPPPVVPTRIPTRPTK